MAEFWRYVGRGEFVAGVPMRDLSAEDVAQMDDDLRKRAADSFLWMMEGEADAEDAPRELPGVGEEIWMALAGAGLETVADVQAADDATLLAISGIGAKRLKKIRAAVGTADTATDKSEV